MLRQIAPYTAIAGLCAALNVVVLIVGDGAHLHYALSTALSFMVCVCVGYAMHCRWTFHTHARVEGLARYALAMSFNFPMALIGVWLFYDRAALPMTLAAPASTVVLTGLNFVLSRWAIRPGLARK